MRSTLIAFAAAGALVGCDSDAPKGEAVDEPQADASASRPTLPPPRTDVFARAWKTACPEAPPVGRALCKSKGLADPGFTCSFSLGDEENRRHTADIVPGDGVWVLADPETGCQID